MAENTWLEREVSEYRNALYYSFIRHCRARKEASNACPDVFGDL
jgi:hypothetical protein